MQKKKQNKKQRYKIFFTFIKCDSTLKKEKYASLPFFYAQFFMFSKKYRHTNKHTKTARLSIHHSFCSFSHNSNNIEIQKLAFYLYIDNVYHMSSECLERTKAISTSSFSNTM